MRLQFEQLFNDCSLQKKKKISIRIDILRQLSETEQDIFLFSKILFKMKNTDFIENISFQMKLNEN